MNDMLGDGMLGGGVAAQAEAQYDKHTGKDSLCPNLSLRVRFIGFILCFLLGKFTTKFLLSHKYKSLISTLGLIIEYVAMGAIGND